jgi:hypothetical protein
VCTGNPIPFLAGHFSHLGHPTTTTTTTQGENNFFGKSDSSPNRIKKVFILFYFLFFQTGAPCLFNHFMTLSIFSSSSSLFLDFFFP